MASAQLSAFLAGIAADPEKLVEYMRDPDAVLAASDLDEEDKVAILSGDPAVLGARLGGQGPMFPVLSPMYPVMSKDATRSLAFFLAFLQAILQAFSEEFPQAYPQAVSKAWSQAFEKTFPPALSDANADTSDAGSPADHPGHGT